MKLRNSSPAPEEAKAARGRFFTIPEAAALLGMSRIAVYKKVRAGEIRVIKIGRTYGIPRSFISGLLGEKIDKARRKKISRGVQRVVREYGELLLKLGRE